MNSLYILFVLPLLIIFSYLFDSFSRKTKFPSVILLMITGILFRFLISFSGYDNFTFLDNLIPVLGTIGLILIVLEGAIELEISRKKLPLILKGFLAAFIILVVNIFVLKWIFENIFDLQNTVAALFAIPLSALVTIFIFGIFISNAKNLLPRILRNYIDLDNSKNEIHEFHILTAESTFLVRTFFFLFFGFSIKVSDFGSITPLLSGIVIFLIMLFIRYL